MLMDFYWNIHYIQSRLSIVKIYPKQNDITK